MAAGSPSSIARDTLTAPRFAAAAVQPRLTGSWLASQGRLPLAFMGLGLTWLVIAAGMLAASPGLIAVPHPAPGVVALTHAWVLGVFITVATGAIYQLAPVALGTTLWSERAGWWHFALHFAGVAGMVPALWFWQLPFVGLFGAMVGLGVILFAVNTWITVLRSRKRDPVAAAIALAAGWLLLTVLAGLALVANRMWNFWPADPLALLRAHAHLGLVGFFLTLLQGVTFRLVPMFTLADVPCWRHVRLGLGLSQIGLLGVVPALAWHAGYLAAVFAAVILGGMIVSGWALKLTLATRKKRRLDPGVLAFLRGLAALGVAAGLGGLLVWPTTPWGSAPGGFSAMVYAVVLFGGGLLPVIVGMMCKIVPFLTWMRAYGPKVGRVPTPAAAALTKPKLEAWAFALQGVAVILLGAGAWTLNLFLLALGAWLLLTGIGLLLIDLGGVLRHLWWPAMQTSAVELKHRTP